MMMSPLLHLKASIQSDVHITQLLNIFSPIVLPKEKLRISLFRQAIFDKAQLRIIKTPDVFACRPNNDIIALNRELVVRL